MKTISSALKNHLSSEVITLTTCWKLSLKDGSILGFTEYDKDITYAGTEYKSSSGFTPSSVTATANLSVDNLNVEGIIDSSVIKAEDVLAGKYDSAEVEIFKLNYEDLAQDKIIISRGYIGEIIFSKDRFVAELRGLTQKLSKVIGEIYSPTCRANLGDTKCKVSMGGFTVEGEITSVENRSVFYDSSNGEEDGYFNFGKIIFTSGLNEGFEVEVKEFSGGKFILVLPAPYEIAVGDEYEVQAGCDKTFDTCCVKFSNAVNFRGEPHVPGTDKMLQTAGTRTEWK